MNAKNNSSRRFTVKRSLIASAVAAGLIWGGVAFNQRYEEITSPPAASFVSAELVPPESSVALPLSVDLDVISEAIGKAVPAVFEDSIKDSFTREISTGVPKIRCKRLIKCRKTGRVKIKVSVPYQVNARVTRGTIALVGHGQELELRVPISFRVSISGRGSIGKSIHETATGDFTLSARLSGGISEDWTPKLALQQEIEWHGQPGGKLFNTFDYTIKGLVEDGLNKQTGDLVAAINGKLNDALGMQSHAADLWNSAHAAWQIQPDQTAWAVVAPKSVSMSPLRFEHGKASSTVRLGLETSLVYAETAPNAPAPSTLPPLLAGSGSDAGGVALNIPVKVSYSSLSNALSKAAQEAPTLRDAGIAVQNVSFYPAGDRLVARIEADVDVSGQLWDSRVIVHVAGRPRIDPETNMLSVESFEIDRSIDNPLVDLLETPLHQLFEDVVSAQLTTDMNEVMAGANEMVAKELHPLAMRGLNATATVSDVGFGEMVFMADTFVLPVELRGQIGLDVTIEQLAAR